MRRVAVQDANVLIDFYHIGLLAEVFALPIEMHTSDLVLAELHDADQVEALGRLETEGHLIVHSFSASVLAEVVAKQASNGRLSLQDCAVWYLAEKLGAILLTGDGQLRRMAENAGLAVHGTLWLLDEILNTGVIDPTKACWALRSLMSRNPRLPEKACRERLVWWCGEEGNP